MRRWWKSTDMPKIVRNIPESPRASWDRWLDGRIWRFELGEVGDMKRFRTRAYLAARTRGLRVTVRKMDDHVRLQATETKEATC